MKKYTFDDYNNTRKTNRVTYHLSLISLILLIPCIIALDYYILIIIGLLLIISSAIYLKTKKQLNNIYEYFKIKCPNCKNDIKYEEEVKYYLQGQIVEKYLFDTSIDDSKRVINIKSYKCENDEFNFTIIETYYFSKNGDLKLLNTKIQVNNN